MEKQAVINQVRKVYDLFREKEAVRNAGILNNYIYRYEQQLLALEKDIHYNCIRGIWHIYSDNDRCGNNDLFIDEISKAERMVDEYQKQEGFRLKELNQQWNTKSCQTEVIIEGSKINSYQDFIDAIEKKLAFPGNCAGSIDCYLHWIRDLSWLPYNTYVFIITHTEDLRQRNAALLQDIVRDFDEIIIPFWDHESVHCIIGGERKIIHLVLANHDVQK